MAAGIVPHRGEPTMCETPCAHKDCQLWRKFFNSTCTICGNPFEEGQRYYKTEQGWVHAVCEEERIEKECGVKREA